MITKSDWQAVHQELTAEERRKLSKPPTTEEMLAYSRGELPAVDAERVRVWLVGNPEVARALLEPFPVDDAKPGDPDYLPESELSKRWASLQTVLPDSAVPSREARVVRFPVWTALAAAVALVFAGLYWQAREDIQLLTAPRLLDAVQELRSEKGRRGSGGAAPVLDTSEGSGVRELVLSDPDRYQWYRVEIFDSVSKEPLWKSDPGQLVDGHLFVLIPRTSLKPGVHRIEVYGLDGADTDHVESYRVRVAAR